jgi:hypothetical protein
MKKTSYKFFVSALFSLLFVHCTFNIENCSAQWVQYSNGIGSYNIGGFALNGSTLYTGTVGINNGPGAGVYLSSNYGVSWTYSGLSPNNTNCLTISGTNVFAGTTEGGIFLSTNNGVSWTAVNNGIPVQQINALIVKGTSIFAGTNGSGAYVSTNNGTSWTLLNSGLPVPSKIMAFGINGATIFAGLKNSNGVYVSLNNGASWTQTSLNNESVTSFAIYGTKIFAGCYGGKVYLSTNNGGSWSLVNNGLPAGDIGALALIGSNLFAGINYPNTYWGVYYSSNSGTSWIPKNEGFSWTPGPPVQCFLITSNYIFAGTGGQVWRRNLSDFIGIKNISSEIPSAYTLSQNYPNPFNPSSIIRFQIKDSRFVTLKVYDMLGKEVATLVNEKLAPGTYEVPFSISQFSNNQISSGVYFYRLTTEGFSETKKMLMIK